MGPAKDRAKDLWEGNDASCFMRQPPYIPGGLHRPLSLRLRLWPGCRKLLQRKDPADRRRLFGRRRLRPVRQVAGPPFQPSHTWKSVNRRAEHARFGELEISAIS